MQETRIHVRTALTLAFLALIVWVAHFSESAHFLFYEDDYSDIVDAMARNRPQMVANFLDHMWQWPLGCPFGFGVKAPLSWLGVQIGGLQGVYVVGWIILCMNAFLFYSLTTRVAGKHAGALGTLAFILFPLITIQAWPTYFMGYGSGLALMLIAMNLFMGRYRLWSYPVIALALTTVQSTIFPFMAAPLLCMPWRRTHTKVILKHLLIVAGILLLL